MRFIDVVKHHPVIAFPVHNRGQGHHRKIAKRNLQRSRRETELDRRATKRFQTRAISSGVTELPDAREADLAPEVAANHAQTSRTAIHFIDLRDVLEFADALLLLPEMSLVVGKRRFRALLFLDREFPIERDFVVRQRFGRNQFLREIEQRLIRTPGTLGVGDTAKRRDFRFEGRASHFDPAAFARVPAGDLNLEGMKYNIRIYAEHEDPARVDALGLEGLTPGARRDLSVDALSSAWAQMPLSAPIAGQPTAPQPPEADSA